MGWFLWIAGWLLFLLGLFGVLAAPLLYQAYVGPIVVIGAIWIGAGAIIERVDMVRKDLKDRT